MRLPLTLAALVFCSAAAPPAGAQPACPDPLPYAVFDYDAAGALRYADSLLAVEDGVELRAFAFDSPRGGRASGVLAVPLAAGPHAGIVNLTGFPVRPGPARSYAAELARRGAVVALLWAPSARPDGTGEGSPVTFTPADSAGQAQYVVDARRAVDVLLARADVDPARLGLVGGSYGGAIGALVAGVEPRLHAVALRVPDGGFVSYFTDPEGPGLPDDMSSDEAARWTAAMSAVEPACYVTEAKASFLLQFGREDRLVSEARARAFADRVRSEKDVRWYEAGHALNEEAAVDRVQWLDRHLGTGSSGPSETGE